MIKAFKKLHIRGTAAKSLFFGTVLALAGILMPAQITIPASMQPKIISQGFNEDGSEYTLRFSLGKGVARAHDNTVPLEGCNGPDTTHSLSTSGGNIYKTRQTICVHRYAYSGGDEIYEAVWRNQCTRNDATWTGCRWQGYIDLQVAPSSSGTWDTYHHGSWCDTCNSSWTNDTLRLYGAHNTLPGGGSTWVRAFSNNMYSRYKLADGTVTTTFLNEGHGSVPVCVGSGC